MMLLQYGREVFFAVTGMVLVHSAAGRPARAWSLWRRRIPAVLVPYVTWSLVYAWSSGGRWSWPVFGTDLLTGGAKYHLYFLVVTLQLYLAFPLLLRFVRATARHAVAVLAAVGAADLVWLGLLQYTTAPPGAGWLWLHAYELLPTYLVYVLVGCYAALHRDAVDAAVRSHGRVLLAGAAAAVAMATGVFALELGWMAPRSANSVLQPAMVLVSAAAGVALYAGGLRFADRVHAGGLRRSARTVTVASEISFGVYLSHPLVLDVLLAHGLGYGHQVVPATLATVLGVVGAMGGAAVLSLVAVRTPAAMPLTGRRWRDRRGASRGGMLTALAGTS